MSLSTDYFIISLCLVQQLIRIGSEQLPQDVIMTSRRRVDEYLLRFDIHSHSSEPRTRTVIDFRWIFSHGAIELTISDLLCHCHSEETSWITYLYQFRIFHCMHFQNNGRWNSLPTRTTRPTRRRNTIELKWEYDRIGALMVLFWLEMNFVCPGIVFSVLPKWAPSSRSLSFMNFQNLHKKCLRFRRFYYFRKGKTRSCALPK